MPLLQTPNKHFSDDISRAFELIDHAGTLQGSILRDDIARASWTMSVGAVDAFFCDAYADLCARALQAKQIQHSVKLTDRILGLRVPAIAAIRPAPTDNWRWRMVARGIIEKQSVLSLKEIKDLFNGFCRGGHKVFCSSNFDSWIVHRDARQRVFGITASDYSRLAGSAKAHQREKSRDRFDTRYSQIFQRRHDCVHNCDRPKVAVNGAGLSGAQVSKIIDDLCFLVARFSEVITDEFPCWLSSLGAEAVTCRRVLQ